MTSPEPGPHAATPLPASVQPTAPEDGRRAVTATYRLQLHADFTFADAARLVPYLADLGVSHIYLSPVLTAVPGSRHGYDVLDHTQVNSELGGRDGLVRLADTCHEHGLGVVVDIVPNHMALVAPQWSNVPLWHVLDDGPHAATAHWFDIDWAALDGRLGLPVLGGSLAEELAADSLTLDTGRADEGPAAGQPVIRYADHVFPLAPGTEAAESDDVATVLSRQHYLLAGWREAPAVLNYRRFFEVNALIGVRVEESDVFEATHRVLLDLHHAGVIDGFRIDHPDGLADPAGYLDTLAWSCLPDTPVWVEKILEGAERLPDSWDCWGTTGYDANAALQVALVDPGTVEAVSAAWRHVGGHPQPTAVVQACKREAVERLLRPEVARLHRLARHALPHHEPAALRDALVELLVAVDVYRAYIRPGHIDPPESARPLREALAHALRGTGDQTSDRGEAIRALGEILQAPEGSAFDPAAARDLAVRFQQTTGPVMAKGIEDTAFYRWHRLVALNEVGADPGQGLDPTAAVLHTWAEHQAAHWPRGMTTLSTHDTKRSEDVRARILAVAGDAEAWTRCTEVFAQAASAHGVDAETGHLLWQTLIGASPVSEERLAAYLEKAVREAKQHTTWVEPDEAYESRVRALTRTALGPGELRQVVEWALFRSTEAIRAVTLGQKLLQLTLPGVPDTYQGQEVTDLSLVDPDNRRLVDFASRRARLTRLDAGAALSDLDDEKMLVTARALRLRSRLPETFGPGSGYAVVSGGEHLLGFLRGSRVAALAVRAAHGLQRAGGWAGQAMALEPGTWADELDGTAYRVGSQGLSCADVFAKRPVALLVRQD